MDRVNWSGKSHLLSWPKQKMDLLAKVKSAWRFSLALLLLLMYFWECCYCVFFVALAKLTSGWALTLTILSLQNLTTSL